MKHCRKICISKKVKQKKILKSIGKKRLVQQIPRINVKIKFKETIINWNFF